MGHCFRAGTRHDSASGAADEARQVLACATPSGLRPRCNRRSARDNRQGLAPHRRRRLAFRWAKPAPVRDAWSRLDAQGRAVVVSATGVVLTAIFAFGWNFYLKRRD